MTECNGYTHREERTITFGADSTIETITESISGKNYTEISFNGLSKPCMEVFFRLISTINTQLHSLVIIDTPWMNDECIELLTATCSSLCKLKLIGRCQITCSGIESIGRNCQSLCSLCIFDTQLKPAKDACESSPKQKHRGWVLDNRLITALINNMSSRLRQFTLSSFPLITCDALEKFLTSFGTSLRVLDFTNLAQLDDRVLLRLHASCQSLVTLKLNFCANITDAGVEGLFADGTTSLEVLEMCACTRLTDKTAELVGRHCPELREVKLALSPLMTGKALRYLSACRHLTTIDFRGTSVRALPYSLLWLEALTQFNVSDCPNLNLPSPDVVEKGLPAIIATLREYDISQRLDCFVLGSSRTGKSSLLSHLRRDTSHEHAECAVPRYRWYPFVAGDDPTDAPKHFAIDFWDWPGKKALESFPSIVFNQRSFYVITFTLTSYLSASCIPQFIAMIQAKRPGAHIFIAGCLSDLSTSEQSKAICQHVQAKVREMEEADVKEIESEIDFLSDFGLFSIISYKRRRLGWLLRNRPKIHPHIFLINEDAGVDSLRTAILQTIVDTDSFPMFCSSDKLEHVHSTLLSRQHAGEAFLLWSEVVEIMKSHDVEEKHLMLQMIDTLEDLGSVLLFTRSSCRLAGATTPKGRPQRKDESSLPGAGDLVCVNPCLFMEAVALIHRDDENAQQLLNVFAQKEQIGEIWPGKKPYDWTLRKAFDLILEEGECRESIIPLLIVELGLNGENVMRLIEALQLAGVMFANHNSATYDMELVIPNLKQLSVSKLYHLPMQQKLPAITQLNSWSPMCPASLVEIGWLYRFHSPLPLHFLCTVISICTTVNPNAQVLSYWQRGVYLKLYDIVVNVSQGSNDGDINILARVSNGHGSAMSVNKGWSFLMAYVHAVEKYINTFPGLHYEVFSTHAGRCVPLLQIIDEFESDVFKSPEALWWLPIKAQHLVFMSHSDEICEEVKIFMQALQTACFDATADIKDIRQASLVILFLTRHKSDVTRLYEKLCQITGII